MLTGEIPRIVVCICTYKRPALLGQLLDALQKQRTDRRFAYSVVVVDNDREQSARAVVDECSRRAAVPIDYYCQPERNIALTRNTAVEHARGSFLAFIDDDEIPGED